MSARTRPLTLVDAALPRSRSLVRDLLLVVAFGSLLALFARITIVLPFTPVPITGQTLWVLLTGALLGRWRGSLAMLTYLAEGLLGMPVFAGGTSAWTPSSAGIPVILGPTAGYLFSYPITAFVVGWLAERGWDRSFGKAALAMVLGEVVIYAVGLAWLTPFVGGPASAFLLGMLPFIPGDTLKLLVAASVLPSGWRLLSVFGRAR